MTNTGHPANSALMGVTLMGAKVMSSCAPCVILSQVSNDDMADFRREMVAARDAADAVVKGIDDHLLGQQLTDLPFVP